MASTFTDAPAPLTPGALDAVPGVLGRIARERAAAYEGHPVPAPALAPAPVHAPVPEDARPPAGRLASALRGPDLAVLAEVKRRSPSRGAIADLDPVAAARAYAAGGAAAVSILTEPTHFGGDLAHLRAVADALSVPALRKDFVVHPAQIEEARDAGAAGVLLIAAVLGDALAPYVAYAHALGLDALVEVHDDAETDRALAAGPALLGVNNRDLRTLDVDLRVAPRLLARARAAGFDGVAVAESGYATRDDLAPVRGLADAVLVGTSLAGSGDLAAAVRALRAEGAPS